MEKNINIFIETYGCQMNVSDSEIVVSILKEAGYNQTNDITQAGIIFINTCSIRENAEERVRKRLNYFRSLKKKRPGVVVGLLGCMADRTKVALMEEEQLLDLIAGPDSYRDLPSMLNKIGSGQRAINTILSLEETYADITPVRLDANHVSAFISIMRGCENFCSYCVVPFTRGKERSRDAASIVRETRELFEKGYREVTLLGQNVNSYAWKNGGSTINFARLLEMVSRVNPLLRVRFSTSHPKDISDELLHTIASYPNICKAIHLPVQSGSNHILDLMNRKYTRERYMERIEAIKSIIPSCAISTDIITGFCDETPEDHQNTLSLMRWCQYDYAFMFKYSERPSTLASETLADNIPEDVKDARLREIINLQQQLSFQSNKMDVGKQFEVLVEGVSKRSKEHLFGRTSQNKVVVFPKKNQKPGDYTQVLVTSFTSATLLGITDES